MDKAMFAAGCFWGVEKSFSEVEGVLNTEVGYAQGDTKNPTYEDVCRGDTNHAEVVLLNFNEQIVSYKNLVNKFYEIHDPTTLNQQGPDRGTQYRSIIIYFDESQKNIAEIVTKELNTSKFKNSITTTVEQFKNYQKAEDYHQAYLKKAVF
jgi:peptide-methionine (S)-S-oxide reductase